MPSERDAPGGQRGSKRQAIVLSGHTGDLAPARAALADPDPALRLAALGALTRRKELPTSALRTALADPDPGVRRRAAELAAGDPAEDLTADLLGLLGDPEAIVSEMAAWALGERAPSDQVIETLTAMARNHEEPLCRESAVAALGALGDPAGLPAILEATQDRPAIRRRAIIALAPFDGPEVDAALERARTDRDWQVRQAAEDQEGRTES